MKFDANLPPIPVNEVPKIAQAAEAIGFDGLWSSETMHDPFLPGPLIARYTEKIQFGTAIAVSFARSPTTLAYTAWDLAQASGGRFILGLGTQVKAHIERRFGMPWPDSVVHKLREQIEAIHALWNCWQKNEKLNYRGEYYKLTLMSPFFNPGPIQHPNIPIFIAGVNTGLAKLAGEVADGFVVHPFHSTDYLKQVILPVIEKGLTNANRKREAFQVSTTVFVVTNPEDEAFVRAQVAFYASTPSYRRVMAHHGWEKEAEQLSSLVRENKWGEMAALVDESMINTFAIVAPVEELADKIYERYAGLADRLGLYIPYTPGQRDPFWKTIVTSIKSRG